MTYCEHILDGYESDERRDYRQAWFARCVLCEERNVYSHQTFECKECHVYVHRRCWQLAETHHEEQFWSAFAAATGVQTAAVNAEVQPSNRDVEADKCPTFDLCEPKDSGDNCRALEPVTRSPFVFPEGTRATRQSLQYVVVTHNYGLTGSV